MKTEVEEITVWTDDVINHYSEMEKRDRTDIKTSFNKEFTYSTNETFNQIMALKLTPTLSQAEWLADRIEKQYQNFLRASEMMPESD